jgi:prephenate dehydrogenase
MNLSEQRVAVVGLGLMGGSLAAALRERTVCGQVWGVARRQNTIDEALERGLIDGGTVHLADGVNDAHVVVLATPVRTILTQIRELRTLLSPGTVLLDLGSTKGLIVEAMEGLPPHIQCIGGHPMCGKERSGIEAADPMLYEGAPFVLVPLDRTVEATKEMARELVAAIGARPLFLDGRRHDRLVAAISHLPYVLSTTLMSTAMEAAQDDSMLWELAAGGFRDTSRVAASDVDMMLDILMTNSEPVLTLLHTLEGYLTGLRSDLEEGRESELRQRLVGARAKRTELFQ